MMQQMFTENLKRMCALAPGSHVLMAVSGGSDSVAMLRLFVSVRESYPLRLSCAHTEHGIRGEDSMEDLAFVRALCAGLDIPFYARSVDAAAYARACGCGLEAAARTLRYAFLEETAEMVGADVIALAHHAQDQAETVLMHAARGSDVRGLGAMRWRRDGRIRPLLGMQREALRAYLTSVGQAWREDVTNADTAYTRNRLRREVLPRLEHAVPGAGAALCRLALAAQRDEDYFDQQLDALDIRMIPLIDGAAIQKQALLPLHPALLSRMLVRAIAFAGIEAQSARVIGGIAQALLEEDAVVNLSGGAHACIGRRFLCLTRGKAEAVEVPLRVPGVTDTPFGRFEVTPAPEGETGDGRLAQSMPAHLLRGARVTGRRPGDVMIPFGMHTPVKLKKLMIDAGIERAMRASVPVVRQGDTVLLAVGLRPAACVRSSNDRDERMILRFLGAWPEAGEKQEKQEENCHD